MLEHRPLHHSPISVASSPAPPEPMSRTRNCSMLVKESPMPHYIMVEDFLAPQYIVVEGSAVPMSGFKNRPCLVVESPPEPTDDRASTTSAVPMSGTKDEPSLADDSPAVPKVNNLCWEGENLVEGGAVTLPKNLSSPPSTTFPIKDPQRRYCPIGGGFRGCNGLGARFCFLSVDPITYGGSWVTTIYCGRRTPTTTPATEPCWSHLPSFVTPPAPRLL